MTGDSDSHRHCIRCGSKLSRFNDELLCRPCGAATTDLSQPPRVPAAFWQVDHLRDALATWHMGRVIHAYRVHPYHGRALTQDVVADWLGITQAQLSRIEKGPAPEKLSKLVRWARTLGIPAHLLWFKLPDETGATLYQVDRQQFLRATLGVTVVGAAQPLLELMGTPAPPRLPDRVGAAEINQIRAIAREFSSWDHTYGGGLVREAVGAQLRYAVHLLDARCTDRHRAELLSAVGFLGHIAGFMAFDAYAHSDARSMFRLAWSCAEEAGDWHLRGKALSSMARQSIWCGSLPNNDLTDDARRQHFEDGLTFIELAMVRADRLTATERAMLHSARARALAKLGRVQEVVMAVGEADDAFAQATPANDPPWMAYYDEAQHSGDTGHALFDLALTGRFTTEARERLDAAVNGHSDAFVRSRAISGIKLASLTMATGDPLEAAVFGKAALADAGHIRSRRAADDLRELAGLSEHHRRHTAVAELRDHIDSLLAAT